MMVAADADEGQYILSVGDGNGIGMGELIDDFRSFLGAGLG